MEEKITDMKVTGIIAEYNPFHKGHEYQIKKARKLTGADYIIVVMSGDFTQRGAPALLDKYARASMALACGADLVLELPVRYACASAEFFAGGAVSILDGLGVVDSLCFGSESGDTGKIAASAQALLFAETDDGYRRRIRQAQKEGLSYPAARAKALNLSDETDAQFWTLPNNILGIEYCKALTLSQSRIRPLTIRRQGSAYHEESLPAAPCRQEEDSFSSATAIRKALLEGTGFHTVKASLPEPTWPIWETHLNQQGLLSEQDFSLLIHYRLLMEAQNGYRKYADITPDLSDKLKKNLNHYTDWKSFCQLLNTKDLTYARASRCLTHILLNLTQENQDAGKTARFPSYARPLAFTKKAAPLLNAIKTNANIPYLPKLSTAAPLLTPFTAQMLREDIQASHIYQTVLCQKYHTPFTNEYQRQLPIT